MNPIDKTIILGHYVITAMTYDETWKKRYKFFMNKKIDSNSYNVTP